MLSKVIGDFLFFYKRSLLFNEKELNYMHS